MNKLIHYRGPSKRSPKKALLQDLRIGGERRERREKKEEKERKEREER
jgi:hypothetical protein